MRFSDIVERNGKYYWVDSCWTDDHRYETMVFPCKRNGKVTSYWDLYCETYSTASKMKLRHMQIVNDIATGRMIFND